MYLRCGVLGFRKCVCGGVWKSKWRGSRNAVAVWYVVVIMGGECGGGINSVVV